MRIDLGKGAPIWISPRGDGGFNAVQGTSRLMVSAEEVPELIRAIRNVTGFHEPVTTTPAKAQLARHANGGTTWL